MLLSPFYPPSAFSHPRFILHPHFLIRVFSSIRIFSSAFYPPSAFSHPRFILHPHFLIRIFSTAIRIRHPYPHPYPRFIPTRIGGRITLVKALFHSSQNPTRKLAARTFIQSQYLRALTTEFNNCLFFLDTNLLRVCQLAFAMSAEET